MSQVEHRPKKNSEEIYCNQTRIEKAPDSIDLLIFIGIGIEKVKIWIVVIQHPIFNVVVAHRRVIVQFVNGAHHRGHRGGTRIVGTQRVLSHLCTVNKSMRFCDRERGERKGEKMNNKLEGNEHSKDSSSTPHLPWFDFRTRSWSRCVPLSKSSNCCPNPCRRRSFCP